MDDIAQAQALGALLARHALPALGVGLVLVLAGAASAFVLLRRWGPRPPAGQAPGTGFFLVWMGVAAAVVLGAAALFAEMMEAMDAEEELGAFDTRLAQGLAAGLPGQVLRVAGVATHLGDPWTLTAIVALVTLALLWRRHPWLALGWVIACAGNGLLNQGLKQVFARVRPVHAHGYAVADGYSFPSGHTSGAVVVFGMAAYLAVRLLPPRWHLPALLLAASLAYAMGASRVLLQVHWASDVLAGLASGLLWLTCCIVAIELGRRWRPRG